jgi:hypothetical protein
MMHGLSSMIKQKAWLVRGGDDFIVTEIMQAGCLPCHGIHGQ